MTIKQILELAGVAHLPKAKLLIEQELINEGFKEAQTEFAQQSNQETAAQAITQFRDLVNRNQVQGNERNIDFWRKQGWELFSNFVSTKSQQKSITQIKRSKSEGESVVLHEDPNWLVVIPTVKDASCYHGKNTNWCTTKPSQSHYEDYVYKRDVVLIYFLQIQTGDKWAIACHTDTDKIEMFDKQDKSIKENQFKQQTGFDPIEFRNKALGNPEAKSKIATSKKNYNDAIAFLKSKMPFTETSNEIEAAIMFTKDADIASDYCKRVKGRWPQWEKIIIRDPEQAYQYARDVIKGRWPEAEPFISQDSLAAYDYARKIINGHWPGGEAAIAKDPTAAYQYARYVIKGRWRKGETAIYRDPEFAELYDEFIDTE
jgi:hypothetical protein